MMIPDCIFPTDNELEIPVLRTDVQPEFCEIPFVCYGEQKRTYDMGGTGTLHFYTDDYRFSSVFEHPEKILKHHMANIVEPNFSLFTDTPICFGMQNVYKKRWVARVMQEKGIGVFVDLNVAPKFYKLNLIGIPHGYNSFCTRGYEARLHDLEFELETARFISGKSPLFVVYGGGEIVKQWCRENKVIYVTPVIAIKNKMKALQRMKKEGIAFMSQDYLSGNLLLEDLMKKQVIDYAQERTENNKAIL